MGEKPAPSHLLLSPLLSSTGTISYFLRSLLAQIVLRWEGFGSVAVKYESCRNSGNVSVGTGSDAAS
jgi:hypothetical protein